MIKSAYNFVPLSNKIFFPDWANQVSQDIPFSDGECGVIDIKITTQSPMYIRNGGNWNDNDKKNPNSEMQDFFNIDNGINYIPGTSLKGVLRNVLEIASFGKIKHVAGDRYSIRDLFNGDYTSKMTVRKNNIIHSKVKTGWLKEENMKWIVTPCNYARVEADDLCKFYGNDPDIKRKQSSVNKYKKWRKPLSITFNKKEGPHKHSCGEMAYVKAVDLGKGNTKGEIVFTGQAAVRKENKKGKLVGKHMEFVFYNSDKQKEYDVSDLKKDFIFIHSDTSGKPNEEWGYWKRKLEQKVPVFYLEEAGKISSMGLAMMFRLPYKLNIHDAIKNTAKDHFSTNPDLSELIFGFTGVKKSLKGRVQVGHIRETADSRNRRDKKTDLVKTVMGSPRPTFYPYYVKQDADKNNRTSKYKTFLNGKAEIRGWKRYPSENKSVPNYPTLPMDRNGNENTGVATMLRPLQSGAVFEGKIRYHNLKKVELGALLWSLTFNYDVYCQHKIGMGKGLGLGKIIIEISNKDQIDVKGTIISYKKLMNSIVENWEETEQIQELLNMANIKKSSTEIESSYPILQTNPNKNEFAELKNKRNKFVLPNYSKSLEESNNIQILTSEQKEKKEREQEAVNKLSEGIKQILNKTGSELKYFVRNIEDHETDKMDDLLNAFLYMKTGHRNVINNALNKGKGSLFKKLKMIEEKTGRKFNV